MGLETGTYISDLDVANPVGATDKRHQGDNHIRLVKSVLKTTFPNATKPFRFPTSATKTGNYTVLSSDDSAVFYCDTSGGAFNMTLPSLASGDAGYEVSVVKSTTDANAVTVVGTINGESNMTLNNRFEVLNLFWTGTVWLGEVIPNGLRVTVITGDLTVTEDHLDGAILSTPSGANKTITLPAVANYRGRTLTIHHTGNTYSTIIDGNASETVNGSATMTLAGTNAFVMLMAMATGWVAIATAATPATAVEMFTGTDTTKPIVSSVLATLWKKDSNIASAGTLTIPDTGSYFHVTGTTTITDIDFTTDTAGREVTLVFDGALTLTHNATTLILPGGASITTAAGDVAVLRSEGSDAVKCTSYTKASGTAVVAAGGAVTTTVRGLINGGTNITYGYSSTTAPTTGSSSEPDTATATSFAASKIGALIEIQYSCNLYFSNNAGSPRTFEDATIGLQKNSDATMVDWRMSEEFNSASIPSGGKTDGKHVTVTFLVTSVDTSAHTYTARHFGDVATNGRANFQDRRMVIREIA